MFPSLRKRRPNGSTITASSSIGSVPILADKKILIIGGPNGAGKTTFATEFLPREADCPDFINADAIAAGLSPFRPQSFSYRAGRLMIEMIRGYVARGESFSFETTLSGVGYARSIPNWRACGYRVILYFVSLSSPEAAIARVRQRVSEGGHDVPEAVVRRRFFAGQKNLERIYRPLVDNVLIYDNSDAEPVLLEESGQ